MHTSHVTRKSILIVDDVKIVRDTLQRALKGEYKMLVAANARQAIGHFQQHPIDLVFLDVLLPDMNGIDLLKKLKQIAPATRVIMLTAVQDIKTAVDAMKAGAFDFLPKPLAIDQIHPLAKRALTHQDTNFESQANQAVEDRLGWDVTMGRVYKLIDCISPCDSNVLIQGANGTGKKHIARTLHNRSTRGVGPYVAINCATIPAPLMERTLFGPGRGVNQDASIEGRSKIELAQSGSLFINNINYLSIDIQAQLQGLIQHKKADVRIIAATNQNLKALVDAGLFRKDLHNRLSELPIDLPLLHQRGDDIGLLLEHFLKHNALQNGKPRKHFSPHARSTLQTCDWPGNAREFEHLVERLCALNQDRTMRAANLPNRRPPVQSSPQKGLKLKNAIRAFERQYILDTLKTVDGSKTKAAQRLGIHRNTLRMKTKALGIAVD